MVSRPAQDAVTSFDGIKRRLYLGRFVDRDLNPVVFFEQQRLDWLKDSVFIRCLDCDRHDSCVQMLRQKIAAIKR
jgi:hypothetical protein